MRQYYIVCNGQELGPYTIEELSARRITPQTMIRVEGMSDACPAQELDELRILFEYQAPGPNPYAGAPAYGSPYGFGAPRGSYMQPQNRPKMPPDNLLWSILCVLFFFPLGIIPLVYSIQVFTHYDRGNYAEAENASRNSLLWAKGLTIAAAVCIGVVIAIFVFIAIAATSAISAAL